VSVKVNLELFLFYFLVREETCGFDVLFFVAAKT
jgi:hypothetical protein